MTTDQGYVDVSGGRLWYERAGGGFPVVLIHPGLWDARVWDDQFDRFSGHHDVVRYDRRGSGRSDPPTRAYSEIRDLLALLAALDIRRCAL
ncbi:MAG TPA: alpha/beta fold hydrolase, partial [Actinomycetota bacterium]